MIKSDKKVLPTVNDVNAEKTAETSVKKDSSMHCGSESKVFEFLTEEQKKKVAVMKMDIKIQMMEMKIKEMESGIELKNKIIADFKQVQEMIKQGK